MSRLRLALLASGGLIAANAAAYVAYLKVRDRPPEPAPRGSVSDVVEEQRQLGIEALRQGLHQQALVRFEAALALSPGRPELESLRDVARKLLDADTSVSPTPAPAPVERAPSERPERRSTTVRRSEPEPGVLLVTTRPDKLVVRLDGKPADLSPARIELPAGGHDVEIWRGKERLLRRRITVRSGQVALLDESFPEPAARDPVEAPSGVDASGSAARVEPVARTEPAGPTRRTASAGRGEDPPPSTQRAGSDDAARPPGSAEAIAADGRLDLVGLIDRPGGGAAAPEPAPKSGPALGPNRSGPPAVLVVRSGVDPRALEAAWAGLSVRAVASASDAVGDADAVVGTPATLAKLGLRPTLYGAGGSGYVLAALDPAHLEVGNRTVAAVGERSRAEMPKFVQKLLGLPAPPSVRRVARAEDLTTVLQVGMAELILVPEGDFDLVARRTKKTLHERRIKGSGSGLAVAFLPGGRRDEIARALGAGPTAALGVTSWTSR